MRVALCIKIKIYKLLLEKALLFIFPNFKTLRFSLHNSLIAQIFLNKDYIFFFLLNSLFSPEDLHNAFKYGTFYLKSFSVHWVRVAFRGKGYRLRKFKHTNKLTLNFGHSHWSKLLLSSSFFFKKLRRQNYICAIDSFSKTKSFKFAIKFIKKLNVYTKRGLRLRKQYIRKRFGKISQVVSSLH